MKKSILGFVLPVTVVIAFGLACGGPPPPPTPTPTPEPLSSEEIVKVAKPYTVFIESQFPRDKAGSGTGIIFHEDGYIVTNAHVVEGASSIKVYIPDRDALSAQLVGVDPCDDLAVIKVTGTGFPVAQFGDSNNLELGREVVVVGYPLGNKLSVTSGIVSKLHVTEGTQEDLIQTSAAVNPGNSGGPLLNREGGVVGIITFKRTGTAIEGTAYAISSNIANEIVPKLTQGQNVNWLGLVDPVPLNEIDPSLTRGLWITDVTPNSPADKARLKTGDILVTVNEQPVSSMADVCSVLRNTKNLDELTYGVITLEELVGSNPTPTPTQTSGYTIYIDDDFSNPASGWSEDITDLSEKGYENGEYNIFLKDTDVSSWSSRGLTIDDFILEVEATKIGGPDLNAYGVQFRHIDRDNFYRFAISSDGYYAVMKAKDGKFEYLAEWTPSPYIKPGQSTNHLAVVAEGSRFSFFINNTKVADVTDQSFSEGDIALMANSGDEAGVHIQFDNVKVWMEEGKIPTTAPAKYIVITDDLDVIKMDIPQEWDDIDRKPWIDKKDGKVIGVTLSATSNLKDFNSYSAPGVVFVASRRLAEAYENDLATLLQDFSKDYASDCTYEERQDYENPPYTGFLDIYRRCGGGGTTVAILGAMPKDQSYVILVILQAVNGKDFNAMNHILDTFQIVDDPP
jgi:serine protease Do